MIFKKKDDEGIPALSAVPAVVDTSVIIDGRIADISLSGFAPGKLLIPRFVLAELQNIADSSDAMRRGRGRRGLEILNSMRQAGVDMEIIEQDFPEINEVDAKLVRLAREISANVLTTDYNLNRVASIEGVRVLNINELANAVRPVVLPGEKMMTKVVQAGKEKGQGVGYLADGTMIVVDQGDKLLGQDVLVEITRVFQTVAGKMLFAVLTPEAKAAIQQAPRQPKNDRIPANGNGSQKRKPHGSKPEGNAPNNERPQKPERINRNQGKGEGSRRSNGGDNRDRKPRKRLSPTQRLENSLLEMTKGDSEA